MLTTAVPGCMPRRDWKSENLELYGKSVMFMSKQQPVWNPNKTESKVTSKLDNFAVQINSSIVQLV